jgi:hypothetical protein
LLLFFFVVVVADMFIYKIRLEQLDKTNEKLDGVNRVSTKRFNDATRDFAMHARMLINMKTDLNFIAKKIK